MEKLSLNTLGVKELSNDLQKDIQGGLIVAIFLLFCAAVGAGYVIGQAVAYAVKAYRNW